MDSLTQIVLGAAVGEATLGRKIGSRAMLWGAFAGFLPDFDVSASFVMDELSALAVHRGITHSIFFAVFFSFIIAWLVSYLYRSGLYQKKKYKITSTILVLGTLLFTTNYLPFMVTNVLNVTLLIISLFVGALLLVILNFTYFTKSQQSVQASYWNWYLLFFLAIITHPILDCFTAYGTQLFLPFSNYRVAFNVISVADPLYTVPFLICLIVAASLRSGSKARLIANWLGLGLSSLYMIWCISNKIKVNRVFENAYAQAGINYSRYQTNPVILNNVLWQGVAEGDTAFYHGYYSLMSEGEAIHHLNTFPKKHWLLAGFEQDPTLQTLKWFSKDYYTVTMRPDGAWQLNDVRFGIFTRTFNSSDEFIFKFILEEKNGALEMHQSNEGPDISKETFKELWLRMTAQEES